MISFEEIFKTLTNEVKESLKERLIGVLRFPDNNNVVDHLSAKYDASNGLVGVIVEKQIDWIEHGRKSGKMPPEKAIIDWCRRHGIGTDNNTIWRIRKAIANNGISPRPVKKDWYIDIDSWVDIACDDMYEKLISYLEKSFI